MAAAASVAKAAAAVRRRITKHIALTIAEEPHVLLQHNFAGGVLLEDEKNSAASRPRAPPRRVTSGPCSTSCSDIYRTRTPFPFTSHGIFYPRRMFCSETGRRVGLPVRALRPGNCKGDVLHDLRTAIKKNPLFRRVKDHALIPDEANVWFITEAGEVFFGTLALLACYNNDHEVSMTAALDEEMIMVSSRFSCVELKEGALGLKFTGEFMRGKTYADLGRSIKALVDKYYPDINFPPDFKEYINFLVMCPSDPDLQTEDAVVYNAALLSSKALNLFLSENDILLRKKARYQGRCRKQQDGKDWQYRTKQQEEEDLKAQMLRRDMDSILTCYAMAKCGPNGETLSQIISADPLLRRSKIIKEIRRRQNQQMRKLQALQYAQNTVKTKVDRFRGLDPSIVKYKAVRSYFLKAGLLSSSQQNDAWLADVITELVISCQFKPSATSDPDVMALTVKAGLYKVPQMKSEGMLLIETGEEVLAAQRDLAVHGFDPETLADRAVQAVLLKDFFTSAEISDYIRWKLRNSHVVLQLCFLSYVRHDELDMKRFFSFGRIGRSRFCLSLDM